MKKNIFFKTNCFSKKRPSLYLSIGFILFSFISTSQNNQYSIITGADLESRIYSNHQSGLPGYHGLVNNMEFTVEDFELLKSNFNEVSNELKSKIELHDLYLDTTKKSFVVYYDKVNKSSDDFLKLIKDTLYLKKILLVDYTESTVLKN